MGMTTRTRLFGLAGCTLLMLIVLGINAYRASLAAANDLSNELLISEAPSNHRAAGHIGTSSQRAERGVEIPRRAATVLEDLVAATVKVDTLLHEITRAVGAQADTVQQIAAGVSSLDQVTRQSAVSAQSPASVSRHTASQVDSLSGPVGCFHCGENAAYLRLATRAHSPPRDASLAHAA